MEQKDLQKVGESVVKATGKGKGPRPKRAKDLSTKLPPEVNAKYIDHALDLFNLPPIDVDDTEQVNDRVLWYLNHCKDTGMRPTVEGLAFSLGVDRSTIYRWENQITRGKKSYYCNVIKKAKAVIQEYLVQGTLEGEINPLVLFFLMKNHFGYSDKQEIEITPVTPLGDQKDMKELEAQYRDSVPIDVEGAEIAEGAESENLGQSDP